MTQTSHILDGAITEALETMAFMTLLPPDDEAAAPRDPVLVSMSFSGPRGGSMEILAGMDFCAALARNIAATDDVNEIVCADALKELCNVTCGLALPRLAVSATDVFDVTVPSIRDGGEAPSWSQFRELPGAAVFNIDGFLIAARLVFEIVQA
jgi:chemotaxis protein CheY-P-specific phosphatase CheC